MQLEPTGERMIVDAYQSSPQARLIYLMHVVTYQFAEAFTRDRRVLDFGCGSGYGSAMIACGAREVVGVDVAEEAVAFARARHTMENLSFSRIEADAVLPFADASFDTVLSFQVFEHVADESRYLGEIARVLRPGGTLVLATPDRSTRLFPFQQPWNRWHLREYDEVSLGVQLKRHFADVRIMKMGGDRAVVNIELKRCRSLKWLSLPFTLPFYPRVLRVALLNLVHRVRGSSDGGGGAAGEVPAFDETSLEIAPGLSPSMNLVAVAQRSALAGSA